MPMSMSCWIGIRRPLPTPGAPDLPLAAPFAAPFSASPALPLMPPPPPLSPPPPRPLTSFPAPFAASGASVAMPTPAARPFDPVSAPSMRFETASVTLSARLLLLPELALMFFAASRAARPNALPNTSATSLAITVPTSLSVVPPTLGTHAGTDRSEAQHALTGVTKGDGPGFPPARLTLLAAGEVRLRAVRRESPHAEPGQQQQRAR